MYKNVGFVKVISLFTRPHFTMRYSTAVGSVFIYLFGYVSLHVEYATDYVVIILLTPFTSSEIKFMFVNYKTTINLKYESSKKNLKFHYG